MTAYRIVRFLKTICLYYFDKKIRTLLQQSHMFPCLQNDVYSEWLNIQNFKAWYKGHMAEESRKERRDQCRIKRSNFIKNTYTKSYLG